VISQLQPKEISMKNYHLTKDGDSWKLKGEGSERASIVADTKAQAIAGMQKFMEDKVGSVKIHKENGQIQEERTYPGSADPHKSKG